MVCHGGSSSASGPLAGVFTDDLVSLDLHNELEQAKAEMRQEKEQFLQAKLLYDTVQTLDEDAALGNAPPAQCQALRLLSRRLAEAECRDVLEMSDANGDMWAADMVAFLDGLHARRAGRSAASCVLGITQDGLTQHSHAADLKLGVCPQGGGGGGGGGDQDGDSADAVLQKAAKLLPSMLGAHLSGLCQRVQAALQPCQQALPVAELPQAIIASQKEIENVSTEHCELKANTAMAAREHETTLDELLDTFVEVTETGHLQQQQHRNAVAVQWMQQRCEAVRLKLNVMEAEVLEETYTPQKVAALSTAQAELAKEHAHASATLTRVQSDLQRYRDVQLDATFANLVEQYALILDETETKKWQLEECRRDMSNQSGRM